MEIFLLLVAVVSWVVVRRNDREETGRQLELRDAAIGRLRDEVDALRKSVAAARPVEGGASVAVATPPSPVTAPVKHVEPPAPVAPPAAPVTTVPVIPVAPAPYVSLVVAAPAVPAPVSFRPQEVVAKVAPVSPVVGDSVPASSRPVAPPAPPVGAEQKTRPPMFRESLAEGNQKDAKPKQSLEQMLGRNWLNRLGIALLVIGMALYLAYRVTHFGPVGKVVTAYGLSLGLLGGGLWLERKERYRVFARAGIGGGWALTFLTTYAMYFFPATQVLTSQGFDLALLFGVGVGMVVHSLRYRSQVVTGLAFLLAFSTVTISQVSAFSLLASAVLALGLEIVCVREAWFVLEVAGIAAAYGNHFLWLDRTLSEFGGPGHSFPLWGESTALLLLFWAIFRVGYCIRKPVDQTAEGLSGLVAVLNSAGVLALMKYQSFHPEWGFRALLALGAVEMTLAFVMRGRRRPAFSVLVVIASVLMLAAIPLRFGGATWPVLWVLQGEALFVCGLMLKERLLRWLGAGVQLLVVVQLIATHGWVVFVERTPELWKIAIAFFCVAVAMWVNGEWLGRGERREEGQDPSPFRGMLGVSSFAAAVCAGLGIWILVPGWTLVLLWALLALVLLEAGLWTRSVGLRLQGCAVLLAGLVRVVAVNFEEVHPRGFSDVRLWAGVGMIAACVLLHLRLRYTSKAVLGEERGTISDVAMWCASALAMEVLYLEVPGRWLALAWAALALLLVEVGLRERTLGPRLQAYGAMGGALGWLVLVNLAVAEKAGWSDPRLWAGVGVIVGCVLIHARLRLASAAMLEERSVVSDLMMWCASALAMTVLYLEMPERWLAVAWAGLALVLLEVGVRERALGQRMQAYGALIGALVWLVLVNFGHGGHSGWADPRLRAGVGVIAGCVLVYERLGTAAEIVPVGERTLIAGAAIWCTSALVSTLMYLELPEKWLAAGWAGFALALMGFAVVRDSGKVRSKAVLLGAMAAVRGIVVNLGIADWTASYVANGSGVALPADWGRLAFFSAVGLLVAAIPIGFVLRRRPLAAGKGTYGMDALLKMPEQIFFFVTLVMLVLWAPVDFHQGALTMTWSGLGVAVFLVALAAGERSFRLSGLGLLLFGVAKLLTVDVWGLASAQRYLLLIAVGVALLLVSFLYSKFGDRLKEYL